MDGDGSVWDWAAETGGTMLPLIPEQGAPVAQPPAPPGPPVESPPTIPKKPPLALWIALGVLAVLLLCGCLAAAGFVVFLAGDSPPEITVPGGGFENGGGGYGNGGGETVGGDEAVAAGAEQIARACSAFAGEYGYGPSVDDVTPDGSVAQFMSAWPVNPFTNEPMAPGAAPGDFTFYTATSMGPGQEYLGYVYGHLSDGSDYTAEYTY